jgi:hypothetical protein
MTITEHLNFSVLSAPIASLDRRALSQAWYSALYGNGNRARTALAAPQVALQPARSTRSATAAVPAPRRGMSAVASDPTRRASSNRRITETERRSPRSALARKIERVLLQPRAGVRKTSFAVRDVNGRVKVLLQTCGPQVRLIAICSPRATANVAAALAHARYALAARGIDLETQLRSEASC